ncbi:MAG: formylglycine-generating enzyme family protein [Planctomycetes bacterium]|nr:formylglycine-generating enzyme family protein [Planctomycetota bacterium]
MKIITALAISIFAFYCMSAAHAVTFEWATVGNPGNADDIRGDGYGGVDYTYRISKTEVTNIQYTEFLNAVADADPNRLYNTSMASDTRGGIILSGSSGSYTYAVRSDSIGRGPGGSDGDDYTYGNKPVVYVSFFDAMRFTNWLENGQPAGAQDAGTTEAGVYDINNGTDEVRNSGITYFIPSEDEWYKAAYYDPNSGGGVYYEHATSNNMVPNNNLPSSDSGNSANFFQSGGYTTGSSPYPMTDVGAYTLSDSPYGTYDQEGNVREWNEAVVNMSARGFRGGSWFNESFNLAASLRGFVTPINESPRVGFRVASIPEPSSLLLGALAAVDFW